MEFDYLTRAMYRRRLKSPKDIKVREELLGVCRDIGVYFYPEMELWPCQHWSRIWELPWAIERAGAVAGKKILEIGPWFSPLGPYFAMKGAKVTGLDVEPHELPGVKVIEGDLRTWRVRRKFDLVTCVSVLEHIEGMSLAFDIPLSPKCPFGVRPPEFGDLLAWMQEEWGVLLPRFPFDEGVVCSSDFSEQASYVGEGIGVCFLEGKHEDPA